MALDEETTMSPAEIDDVLRRHETGVLALAREDTPYAIPISYGYDPDARRFYLRLVSTPESEKARFLSSPSEARLVVYEEDDPTYRSVLAVGRLKAIELDEVTVERIEQYDEAKRPLFEIWGEDRRDLDVTLYELEPTELDGRIVHLRREAQPIDPPVDERS